MRASLSVSPAVGAKVGPISSWKAFAYNGVDYDLAHLNGLGFKLVIPAKGDKQEQVYRVNVVFGLHCFTKGPRPGESHSADLEYSDGAETRLFCFDRYELSKQLPVIMPQIGTRQCYHTAYGDFFLVEVATLNGNKVDYAIFFKASKAAKGNKLNVYVSSAYVPDASSTVGGGIPLKQGKPIAFRVIAHNTCAKKPIRMQP